MCLICKDLILGKLTAQEALRNYWELADSGAFNADPEHAEEVADQVQVLIFQESHAAED